jgi:hypothetical protein
MAREVGMLREASPPDDAKGPLSMGNSPRIITPTTPHEEETPLSKAGQAFDALDKVLKMVFSAFLAAKGLGLVPPKLNLSVEQLLLPVVLIFVVMSSLPRLIRWAFPHQTERAETRSQLASRQRALRQAALALYSLAIIASTVYWTKREIINRPPQIEHILPQNAVIVPNDSTTLKLIVLDPDGSQDIARIDWSPDPGKGSIEVLNPPANDVARFQAPPSDGAFNIYVTVTDHSGKSDTGAITIYVVSPLQ